MNAARRVSGKFFPRLLTHGQNEDRLQIVLDILQCAKDDPEFTENVVTTDES